MPQRNPENEPDAIGRVRRFDHVVTLPVLGIPVTYETNDARVLAIVEEAFGRWRDLDPEEDTGVAQPCRVRIVVQAGEEIGAHAALRYRVGEDGYVLVTTTASAGYADPLRRESRAWVTDALVADTQHFRYGVLEGLTIALLSRLDRQPVHAAAIVRDGAALLLAGPSGSGKSTLAYAAARAGIGVLAEDVVYVQSSPALRVWGGSPFLHLPAESARFFADVDCADTVLMANGKQKVAVDLRRIGAAVAPFVDRAAVCIVRRAAEGARGIRAISADEVAAALGDRLESGFDLFERTIGAVHGALAAGGGWELTVAGPPADHVPLLRTMLDEVVARP